MRHIQCMHESSVKSVLMNVWCRWSGCSGVCAQRYKSGLLPIITSDQDSAPALPDDMKTPSSKLAVQMLYINTLLQKQTVLGR